MLLGGETQYLAELLQAWVFRGMAGMEPVSPLPGPFPEPHWP